VIYRISLSVIYRISSQKRLWELVVSELCREAQALGKSATRTGIFWIAHRAGHDIFRNLMSYHYFLGLKMLKG
jgi:hypothetical protein